jgi:hypothetical protein
MCRKLYEIGKGIVFEIEDKQAAVRCHCHGAKLGPENFSSGPFRSIFGIGSQSVLMITGGLDMNEEKSSIVDIDREFENSRVKVIISRDMNEFEVGDGKIGPFKSGDEVELLEWIAEVLVDEGVAKFRDQDMLDLASLSKIHWKETIPSSRQLPPLDPYFYCELRRLIGRLRKESCTDPSRIKDYEKALSLSRDIVDCRLRKIASLAASPTIPGDLVKGMAREERTLYHALSSIMSDWNKRLLSVGITSES